MGGAGGAGAQGWAAGRVGVVLRCGCRCSGRVGAALRARKLLQPCLARAASFCTVLSLRCPALLCALRASRDPLLDIAMELEKIAVNDEYFVKVSRLS